MRQFIIVIFILISVLGFSQEAILPQIDSLGQKQGFSKHPSGFNLIKNENIVKGFEIWESGYYIDDYKEGLWNCFNYDGKLIGQRYYRHDTITYEIHYLRKKIISLVRFKTEIHSTEDEDIADYGYKPIEIISFNRCGKVKQRTYYTPDGDMITEKY